MTLYANIQRLLPSCIRRRGTTNLTTLRVSVCFHACMPGCVRVYVCARACICVCVPTGMQGDYTAHRCVRANREQVAIITLTSNLENQSILKIVDIAASVRLLDRCVI